MIDELGRELGAVGVRGRLRHRIVTEFRDHLACDPEADLGEARTIARQFADELGTTRSRRAALAAFVALGVAGVAYAVAFVAVSRHGTSVPELRARTPVLGDLATVCIVLAPQLAFAAGSLALLRALRRRNHRALPASEVQVLARRTGFALAAGLLTMGSVALYGYEYGIETGITYAGAAVGGGALLLALSPALASMRVRTTAPGDAGDVFVDLGQLVPRRLRGNPWRLARAVAVLIGLGVWAAGIAQGDPIDGLARGVIDALACLGGFAVFGRFLGLRR
jgi:hypothetical protein